MIILKYQLCNYISGDGMTVLKSMFDVLGGLDFEKRGKDVKFKLKFYFSQGGIDAELDFIYKDSTHCFRTLTLRIYSAINSQYKDISEFLDVVERDINTFVENYNRIIQSFKERGWELVTDC